MAEISELKSQGNKKNLFPVLIISGLLALGYLFFSLANNTQLLSEMQSFRELASFKMPFQVGNDLSFNASNSIDEARQIEVYEYKADSQGQTPFQLLNENAEVEYDQYDFGVFVTSINDQQSNNEYYWALYVNEEFAQMSSDQIELEVGDLVEWRWEEIESYQE